MQEKLITPSCFLIGDNQSYEPSLKGEFEMFKNIDRQKLQKMRKKLQNFAQTLGPIMHNKLREDVVDHCNKLKMNIKSSITFEQISKLVNNRIQKMIKNKRIKQNWSEEDVIILMWVVSKYADWKNMGDVEKDLSIQCWEDIAELIPGVENRDVCRFKWLSLQKNNLAENNWSETQSNLLFRIVSQNKQKDWTKISQLLYDNLKLQNKVFRCPKQCREHWNCYLNPSLKKGPWEEEEDYKLLSCVNKNNGMKKWSEIVCHFDGRTENSLKNRYNLIIEKEIKAHPQKKGLIQLDIIRSILQRKYVGQFVNGHPIDLNSMQIQKQQIVYENIESAQQKYRMDERDQNSDINTKQNGKFMSDMKSKANKVGPKKYKRDENSEMSQEEYKPPKKHKMIQKQRKRKSLCRKDNLLKINQEKVEDNSGKNNKIQTQLKNVQLFGVAKQGVKESNPFDENFNLFSSLHSNHKLDILQNDFLMDRQFNRSQDHHEDREEINLANNEILFATPSLIRHNSSQLNINSGEKNINSKIEKTDLNNIQIIQMNSELFTKLKEQYTHQNKNVSLFVPCILEKQSNRLKIFNFQTE